KDHFEIIINSTDDYSSSDDDSLYYENIEYVEASPHDSEFVSLEVEKVVIRKDEEIKDDNLREKLLKPSLPPHLLNLSWIGLTPFIILCPNLKTSALNWKRLVVAVPLLILIYLFRSMKLSLSMTIILKRFVVAVPLLSLQSDISLPEYDSFIFDLSNDQFPPTDMSDFTHEEFGDELAHIICPPKYDCFYFGNLPEPGELISSLNSRICENLSSKTCVNLPVEDDYFPLLAYVVWIFLAYLTYPVIPPHLHSFRNEDTIFDPGITINRSYSFKPGLSHRCGTFNEFNTHCSHLNESPMEMLFSTLFPMDQ
nr:hypothetical protein [Tanacetum cinerariifolium]